jgi:hypothetical protein
VVEVIEAIAERRPVACGVGDLIGVAGLDPPHLAGALLEGMRAGLLTAWLEPPRAVPAGERPRASALARHQARSGQPATSLLHTVVVLDPAGAQLLDLLDGTRDAAAIAIDLQAATGIELPPDAVASNLHAFGVAGLLEGDGP